MTFTECHAAIGEIVLKDPAYVVRRAAATVDRLDPGGPGDVSATSTLDPPVSPRRPYAPGKE
jgi:hypothetical protein